MQDALDEYKQKESEKRAQEEAQEAAKKEEALKESFWYKFVTRVMCPLRTAACWLSQHLTFLQPLGEAISEGFSMMGQGIVLCFMHD